MAAAASTGIALVIGNDIYADRRQDTSCGQIAHDVRDRLRDAGFITEELINAHSNALRDALDAFSTRLGDASPGNTLIYVCAAAMVDHQRLFVLPSDVDLDQSVQLKTSGVVVPALLNTLAGTRGTVLADLELLHGQTIDSTQTLLSSRLPPGLHLAIATGRGSGVGVLGQRMTSRETPLDQGWNVLAPALQAALPNRSATLLLLPPAATAPPTARGTGKDAPPAQPTPPPPPPPSAALLPPPAAPAPPPERMTKEDASPDQPALPPSMPPSAPLPPAAAPPVPATARPAAIARATTTPVTTASASAGSGGNDAEVHRAAPIVSRPTPRLAGGEGKVAAAPIRRNHLRHEPQNPAQRGSNRVARLQGVLAAHGNYSGPVDGVLNDRMQSAILNYQSRLGDAPTGVLTRTEIIRLLNPAEIGP